MTLTELERVLKRHRFRALRIGPARSVWVRGGLRRRRRFVAILVDGRLDLSRESNVHPVAEHTIIHDHSPEELDLWVHRTLQT